MKTSFSSLTQSQFYSQSFNSAIFDGPIRIYFSQFHESYALKVYFHLQDSLTTKWPNIRDLARTNELALMIMIYPSEEAFQIAFKSDSSLPQIIAEGNLNGEPIMGVMAPFDESLLESISIQVEKHFLLWTELPPPVANAETPNEYATESHGDYAIDLI